MRSIGHLRDILKLSSQAIEDLNQHQRLVAVSHATRDFHVVQGLDADQMHRSQQWRRSGRIPAATADAAICTASLACRPSARLIAVIGQLGLRKGTDVALAAALQIADRAPDVHWLIVGERTSNKAESHDFEASLQSIAAEKPLAGRVISWAVAATLPTLVRVHAARPRRPPGAARPRALGSGRLRIGGRRYRRRRHARNLSRPIPAPPVWSVPIAISIWPMRCLRCSGTTIAAAASAPPPAAGRNPPSTSELQRSGLQIYIESYLTVRSADRRPRIVGSCNDHFVFAVAVLPRKPRRQPLRLRFIRSYRENGWPPRRLTDAGNPELANRLHQVGDLSARKRAALRRRKALAG